MPITPEERARADIDRLLIEAGWVVQDKRSTNLSIPLEGIVEIDETYQVALLLFRADSFFRVQYECDCLEPDYEPNGECSGETLRAQNEHEQIHVGPVFLMLMAADR
jgi:hypothetical protein